MLLGFERALSSSHSKSPKPTVAISLVYGLARRQARARASPGFGLPQKPSRVGGQTIVSTRTAENHCPFIMTRRRAQFFCPGAPKLKAQCSLGF
jgi:hypothetical protein